MRRFSPPSGRIIRFSQCGWKLRNLLIQIVRHPKPAPFLILQEFYVQSLTHPVKLASLRVWDESTTHIKIVLKYFFRKSVSLNPVDGTGLHFVPRVGGTLQRVRLPIFMFLRFAINSPNGTFPPSDL